MKILRYILRCDENACAMDFFWAHLAWLYFGGTVKRNFDE